MQLIAYMEYKLWCAKLGHTPVSYKNFIVWDSPVGNGEGVMPGYWTN